MLLHVFVVWSREWRDMIIRKIHIYTCRVNMWVLCMDEYVVINLCDSVGPCTHGIMPHLFTTAAHHDQLLNYERFIIS